MNMSKSRDILAKMPSPKVIFYAFWLVTVKVLNSSHKILYLIFDYPHKHYTFKYFEV